MRLPRRIVTALAGAVIVGLAPLPARADTGTLVVFAIDTSGSVRPADLAHAGVLTAGILDQLPRGTEAALFTFDDQARCGPPTRNGRDRAPGASRHGRHTGSTSDLRRRPLPARRRRRAPRAGADHGRARRGERGRAGRRPRRRATGRDPRLHRRRGPHRGTRAAPRGQADRRAVRAVALDAAGDDRGRHRVLRRAAAGGRRSEPTARRGAPPFRPGPRGAAAVGAWSRREGNTRRAVV